MRIIETDNFGGDHPNERFLLFRMSADKAERIAAILNEDGGMNTLRWYRVVPDDYVLVPGFEP